MKIPSVTLYLAILTSRVMALDYQLDRDTATNCSDRVPECRTSDTTFLECPETCSENLDGGLMVQGLTADKDEFFTLEAKSADGNIIDFDRFDGYVTVIAALPLLPGMAQYYYELTEYLAKKFPYAISTAIIPFQKTKNRSFDIHNLDLFMNSKSIVLETHVDSSLGTHPIVKYVESVERNQSDKDPLYDDRAIIFIVSHNGRYVERRVCPNKDKLEKVIEHYLEFQDVETA